MKKINKKEINKKNIDKKNMDKKGELTTATIITIVLLVIAFAIILFFIFRLNWGGMVDEQVCHNSVIYRATLHSTAGIKSYVPLKCKTQKICLSADGKDCKEFENFKGVTKIKVKKGEEGNKQVEKLIATEVVKCWRMMGEGKVTVFTDYLAESWGIGGVGSSCVVCNRIAFSGVDLTEIDVEDYMIRHAIPDGDISYYDFLSGQGGKVSLEDTKGGIEITGDLLRGKKIESLNEDDLKQFDEDKKAKIDNLNIGNLEGDKTYDVGDYGELYGELSEEGESLKLNKNSDELAIVFSQISAPSHGDTLKKDVIAALTVLGLTGSYRPGYWFSTIPNPAVVPAKTSYGMGWRWVKTGRFAPKSAATVTKLTTKGTAGIIVGAIALTALIAQQGNVAHNRAVTAGYCGDVSMGSEARDGCSVVRTINYNEEDFVNYCSIIESIP